MKRAETTPTASACCLRLPRAEPHGCLGMTRGGTCYNAPPLITLSHLKGSAMELLDPVECILRHKGSQVHSIPPDVTVYEALEKMADENIGALVVMNENDLVGIFSERDYVRKVIRKGRSSREMRVNE